MGRLGPAVATEVHADAAGGLTGELDGDKVQAAVRPDACHEARSAGNAEVAPEGGLEATGLAGRLGALALEHPRSVGNPSSLEARLGTPRLMSGAVRSVPGDNNEGLDPHPAERGQLAPRHYALPFSGALRWA